MHWESANSRLNSLEDKIREKLESAALRVLQKVHGGDRRQSMVSSVCAVSPIHLALGSRLHHVVRPVMASLY